MSLTKLCKLAAKTRDYDSYTEKELIRFLELADDAYYNYEAIISDDEYDSMYKYVQKAAPNNTYFLGIGSDVRGGKVKLPYAMGSLDQVEVGEIQDWITKWSLKQHGLIITDKLDGISAMIVYDNNGNLQIAYSRGNGVEGADITRHIRKIKSIPQKISGPMVIRGELIISHKQWETMKDLKNRRGGGSYKNQRNTVAGIMNSKTNSDVVYNYIDFVAYDVLGFDGIDKVHMLRMLENHKFLIPNFGPLQGDVVTDELLSTYLNARKSKSDYEIDGIVIDVNLSAKRDTMTSDRDTLNPQYSIKYKVRDAGNYAETVVKYVEWNISKHKYWKPRLVLEPVELMGVTVQHTTGYNAKYILDNNIGPGTVIAISRNGEVVPNPLKVITPTKAQLPEGNWEWTETEVDIISLDTHDDITIKQILDFFTSIKAPHIKKGNIVKLFNSGFNTIESIIVASEQELVDIIGENGKKIYSGIREKLTNIPLHVLMGATQFFGRGVGERKFRKLISAMGWERLYFAEPREIAEVNGFDVKTANKIVGGIGPWLDWIVPLDDNGYISIVYTEDTNIDDSPISGKKVCITGFRDKDLQQMIEQLGGENQNGVSSKTDILVASNPDSNSGKLKKARSNGVKIMGVDEFKQLIQQ